MEFPIARDEYTPRARLSSLSCMVCAVCALSRRTAWGIVMGVGDGVDDGGRRQAGEWTAVVRIAAGEAPRQLDPRTAGGRLPKCL